MLRIGKLTDYAILIMTYLAREPEKTLSATQLAEALMLTAPTTSKILKILADAQLVKATRGAGGGYALASAADAITVLAVLEAMEGKVALTSCCEVESDCAMKSRCLTKENWKQINQVIYHLLNSLTIKEMLNPISVEQLLLGLADGK